MTHILVVEDDASLATGLQYNLKKAGYDVTLAGDGETALDCIRRDPPHLIILDLMLPKQSGFDVLQELQQRQFSSPVMILSARGLDEDKVRGFDLGAADYVTKPFSLAELLARIRVRLAERLNSMRFKLGQAEVDLDRGSLYLQGRNQRLTQTEIALLRLLFRERGQTVPRERLLQSIWSLGSNSSRTLDTHMARLRKKVEPEPARPRFLLTVHGVGYCLQPDSEGEPIC